MMDQTSLYYCKIDNFVREKADDKTRQRKRNGNKVPSLVRHSINTIE